MKKAGCRISDEGISAILLKVLPGKEVKVLENLRHKGNRFLGLGHYDVLLLKENDEFEPLTEYVKDPNVIDWGSLHVFKYNNPNNESKSLKMDKILGVCCLKFDYRELKNVGIAREVELASDLYSAFDSNEAINVIIGGGIGFYDLLIFVESSNFGSIDHAIATICEISERTRIVKDIITIPCLNYDSFVTEPESDDFRKKLSSALKDKVSTHFIVDCIPGPEKDVYSLLNDCFKSVPMSIFGEHDFIVKLKDVEAGEFLSNVLLFREKAMNFVVSTQTIFEWSFRERPSVTPASQPSIEPHFSQLASKLADIRNKSDNVLVKDLSSEFWRIVGLIKRAQMNLTTNNIHPQICDLLFEIFNAIQEMDRMETSYDKYLNISEALTEITYSLSQRYSGVQGPYLFSELNSGVEEYGGINRIILALESLPKVCLKRFNLNWKGFCLFGYVPEPRRFEFGIINMPRAYLFNPEEWHGAFHESGHEVFNLWFNNLPEEEKTKLEKEMYREDLDRAHQLKFLWEVFSDAFSFCYGFMGDWRLYIQFFWNFLMRDGKDSPKPDLDHLTRTFALFRVFRLGKDETPLSLKTIADRFVADFCEILKMNKPEKLDWPSIKAKLIANLELSEKGVKAITKAFFDNPLSPRSSEPEYAQSLHEGIILTNIDPAIMLYNLMKIRFARQCTFRERMTCLMSLLDYSLRSDRIEKPPSLQ